MLKKISKILLVFVITPLLLVFLSGCWDAMDINAKRILTAVALDKKDNEIYLYVEIANIEGGNKGDGTSAGSSKKYIHVKAHGKTIIDARENMNRQIDKQLYLSAIRTLILTENFAKEDLVEYVYRLRSDELYRKKAITVITKEDPEELFKNCNDKDLSVGFSTEEILGVLEKSGESFSRTTSRLIENLSNRYTGFLIPCIGLQNKEISLVGYSVLDGTTINGFIPVEGSKAMIFLKTDKSKFDYIVPYKDNKLTIEVSQKKRNFKSLYENGKISFDCKFYFDAKLMYGDKKTPYNFDDAAKAEVTKILTQKLKDELTDAIVQSQYKFKCDYLQFDDEFRVRFPVEFEKMDWQNEFQRASFNIDVNVNFGNTWMMDYKTNLVR